MFKINFINPFRSNLKNTKLSASVEFIENNSRKFLKRMPVLAKNNVVYLESHPRKSSTYSETAIYNSFNDKLAFHNYDVYNMVGEMDGSYMQTELPYRHHGLGEILRLASIIEMKENNINKMTIFSMPEAIKFHYKYGFRPNIGISSDIMKTLNFLLMKCPDESFKNQAKVILNTVYANGCIDDAIYSK